MILAFLLLALPLQWIFAAAAAAMVHELSHILAVKLCKGRVTAVRFGIGGAQILASPLPAGKACICSLAGPASGMLLLLLSGWLPRLAICGAFQAAFNLLPLYPLDGGRALQSAVSILFPSHAQRICDGIQKGVILAVWILAIYASVRLKLGFMTLLFAAAILYKVKNTPCK